MLLQTADNYWKPSLLDEHSKLFFKVRNFAKLFSITFKSYISRQCFLCCAAYYLLTTIISTSQFSSQKHFYFLLALGSGPKL